MKKLLTVSAVAIVFVACLVALVLQHRALAAADLAVKKRERFCWWYQTRLEILREPLLDAPSVPRALSQRFLPQTTAAGRAAAEFHDSYADPEFLSLCARTERLPLAELLNAAACWAVSEDPSCVTEAVELVLNSVSN